MEIANNKQEKDKVFKDLKRLVNDYLSKTPLEAIGPRQMYYKSAFLVCCWITAYTLLLTVGPSYWFVGVISLVTLLILTCGLEFCIMHDASHFTFSSHRWLNKVALNLALSVLGACPLSWHQEHVVRHHGHTNILGSDPDVYASHVLRLHPDDKWHWWHQWQHYYGMPLFSFMWLHWVYNDLVNAIFNTYQLSRRRYWLFWTLIFVGLIPHIILGLVIPYLAFKDIWVVGIGYVLFFMSLSIVMAMTFVLAHVSDGQTFYQSHDDIQKDWAVHQLETTADFAVNNRFLIFLLGGLNFQVEHHIFPAICHLHYPQIQKIVKKYCNEHGVRYHEEETLWGALRSHVVHLKTMSVRPDHVKTLEGISSSNSKLSSTS